MIIINNALLKLGSNNSSEREKTKMLKLTANKITVEDYNVLKARKERESVKKSLVEFLTNELTTLKSGDVREINLENSAHYYSVLKALRMFDSKIEYKLNSEKSRVFGIAIKVK